MFNYYKRIADYANDLEKDGKVQKAEQLRDILKNENRCIFCGNEMVYSKGAWTCTECIGVNYVDYQSNENFS